MNSNIIPRFDKMAAVNQVYMNALGESANERDRLCPLSVFVLHVSQLPGYSDEGCFSLLFSVCFTLLIIHFQRK